MVEARNFKSGMQIDHRECSPKMLVRTTIAASWVLQQHHIANPRCADAMLDFR